MLKHGRLTNTAQVIYNVLFCVVHVISTDQNNHRKYYGKHQNCARN